MARRSTTTRRRRGSRCARRRVRRTRMYRLIGQLVVGLVDTTGSIALGMVRHIARVVATLVVPIGAGALLCAAASLLAAISPRTAPLVGWAHVGAICGVVAVLVGAPLRWVVETLGCAVLGAMRCVGARLRVAPASFVGTM